MENRDLVEKIIVLITNESNLTEITHYLREIKEKGIKQKQVYDFLEIYRMHLDKEQNRFEDRILEVMDIVSGFCSQNLKVW